ncbi:MAG: hypothetical protein AB8F78_13645 [Saprospiraceae bacterium]
MTKFLKLSFLFCLSIFVLASCDKEELTSSTDESLQFFLSSDEDQTADALVMPAVADLQALSTSFSEEGRHRFHGDCFTLVFPVDIVFPDGTTSTANDGAELKQSVRDWVAAGGTIERGNRPMLVYPLDVQLADGTIETVADRTEIRTILQDCRPEVEQCVTLIYPVSFDLNGTVVSYADAASLRQGLADYKAANPDAPKPAMVFPVSVETADGEVLEVNSIEEIRRIKRACLTDRRNGFRDCFGFNYPLTLVNGASETLEVTTNAELRRALSHSNRQGNYAFQFPFEVTKADGTVLEITSSAEFRRLRQSCR